MLIGQTLPFVTAFIDELDTALKKLGSAGGVTPNQKDWLGFYKAFW